MPPILNTRADLDALAGTPDHAPALRLINGSRATDDGLLTRLSFDSEAAWNAYLDSAGVALEKPAPACVPQRPVSELKSELKKQLAQSRYTFETSGITLGEVPIATDRESQSMLVAALVQLSADESVQWKGPDGVFRPVTRDQLAATARHVKVHVQACFAREAELSALIDLAETVSDCSALSSEIKAFWPVSA